MTNAGTGWQIAERKASAGVSQDNSTDDVGRTRELVRIKRTNFQNRVNEYVEPDHKLMKELAVWESVDQRDAGIDRYAKFVETPGFGRALDGHICQRNRLLWLAKSDDFLVAHWGELIQESNGTLWRV